MRQFTGPGKVKDDLRLPSSTRSGINAALYNFDIDDASVKVEHQLWLDEHAVPVLTSSRNTRLNMKGLASRSGKQSYNLDLSEKRVRAVKNYLLGRGVQDGQIGLNWFGEDEAALLGVRDGTESEEWRAVALQIQPPTRLGQPRFERVNPADRLDGFDDTGFTPWLMVPAYGFRRVLLLVNAEGMTLATDTPGVARPVSAFTNAPAEEVIVPSDRELIRIEGQLPGEAEIVVRELNGRVAARLEVSVLERKEVPLAFHFVSDTKQKTTRKLGAEDALLQVVNQVYQRQANVTFVKKSAGPLPFTQDLGDPSLTTAAGVIPTSLKTLGNKFQTLAAKGDGKARINVYFVWEFQRIATVDTDARVDAIPGHHVVFEDKAGTDQGLSLAHECSHCLGLNHRDSLQELVMWPFTDQRGGRLLRDEILTAHRGV